ncbi:MAG: ATP-binding cassette domain-containing protein [Streptosporangiales bacterium]|nr:ATP-binding cassette domain-containing protein [Streptosporangiales bacterium]
MSPTSGKAHVSRAAAPLDATTVPVAVEFRGIGKDFGTTVAVSEVNLPVLAGEFLTILGPSGSGKTTLLKMLAGFEAPSRGEILRDGDDLTRLPPGKRDIGMVFQQYALFPHMTVAQNIAYGLRMRGWSKQRQAQRVTEMLELVRLGHLGTRLPRELSGGQQQRVALARALAFGPGLLLMDEPLGALDRALRLEMEEEVRRIHRRLETTVVYVTHDQEEALSLSDRVAIMRDGRMVAVGAPDALYERPPTAFVAAFFSGCNLVPAELVSRNGDTARVSLLGQQIDVACLLDPDDRDGILTVPASAPMTQSTDAPHVRLPCVVEEVLNLGDHVQVTCVEATGALDRPLTVRRPASDVTGLTVGQRLTLHVQVERLSFVPT